MTGWLIVNEFLNTDKFKELQELFLMAADNKGIDLKVYTNAQFMVDCGSNMVYSKWFNYEVPDFIIFYDKDIALCKAFEDMGIPVFNRSEAIEICDSKLRTAEYVREFNMGSGSDGGEEDDEYDSLAEEYEDTAYDDDEYDAIRYIRMPRTFKVPFTYENIGISTDSNFEFIDFVETQIGYPMVIKECYSSFGMGVHLANNREEAVRLISKFGNKECLIQEYIASAAGHDIRLQMVGDVCVAAMMRTNDKDFRANITNGGVMSEYEPTEADLRVAGYVMEALSLDFAGIDLMHDDCSEPLFCEANSNAHFKNLYDLTGINAAEMMLDYIIYNLQDEDEE